MPTLKSALLSIALLALAPPAIAQSTTLSIDNAWVRVYEGTVTAYFEISNTGAEPERLLGVSTPVADQAALHRSLASGGRYTYPRLGALEIGASSVQRFRPGAIHVRLSGVNRRLEVGDSVPLTLRFARAGTIELSAKVSNQLLGSR